MNPEVTPIHALYEADPSLYDAVSVRDYAAQAAALLGELPPTPRVLELFAGPARHARALKAAGARVSAVDASAAMRSFALGQGGLDPDDYLLARLPRLPLRGPFDAVLFLRYASGILEPAPFDALLRRSARLLRPGGLALFELRRMSVLRDCERRAGSAVFPWTMGRRIRLTCPDGPLEWSDEDWVMSMTLKIEILKGPEVLDSRRYGMSERLVKPAELLRFAGRTELFEPAPLSAALEAAFPDGGLLSLRRR